MRENVWPIVCNLLSNNGAARYFADVKNNELTEIVGGYLAKLGPYYAWAPYGLSSSIPRGVKIANLNLLGPLIDKRTQSARKRMMAKAHADGIVREEDARNQFFTGGARELGADCILGAIETSERPDKLSLPGIMKAVCTDPEGFFERIEMTNHEVWSEVFAGYRKGLKRGKGFEDILGTLISEASFLKDAGLQESLCPSKNEIPTGQWGAQMMTIAQCLPMELLDQSGKINRLFTQFIIGLTINSTRPRKTKIDLLIDETASMGKLDSLVDAYRTGRAYGARTWTSWTDIPSMNSVYGEDDAAAIRSNSMIEIYFPSKDYATALHVSKKTGIKDVVTRSKNVSWDREGWPTRSESVSQHQREVMTPGEFQDMAPSCHLLWVRGVPGTIRAVHKPYFKQWRYLGKYGKNSLYGK